jgi:hypothetical protein
MLLVLMLLLAKPEEPSPMYLDFPILVPLRNTSKAVVLGVLSLAELGYDLIGLLYLSIMIDGRRHMN